MHQIAKAVLSSIFVSYDAILHFLGLFLNSEQSFDIGIDHRVLTLTRVKVLTDKDSIASRVFLHFGHVVDKVFARRNIK